MQYKIPVQIENEDPIIFGLSIRQLFIIIAFGGIGYVFYSGLEPSTGTEIALIPLVLFVVIGITIAVFKHSEMTFTVFILSFIRYKVNLASRTWGQGVDSFSAMDIGYVSEQKKTEEKVDFSDKMNKIKELDDKLKKI